MILVCSEIIGFISLSQQIFFMKDFRKFVYVKHSYPYCLVDVDMRQNQNYGRSMWRCGIYFDIKSKDVGRKLVLIHSLLISIKDMNC